MTEDDERDRVTVTFQGDAARAIRNMASHERTTTAELARRALFLMDVYLDLADDEELVVIDSKGVLSRLRFPWRFRSAQQAEESRR